MFFKKIVNISLLTMFLLVFFGFNQVHAIATSQLENYRIKIHSSSNPITIRVDNNYYITADATRVNYEISSSGEEIIFEKINDKVVAKKSNGDIIVEGSEVKLLRRGTEVKYFEVKGIDGLAYAKYPDNVAVRLDSSKTTMLVINITALETYLKGVIPHEMGASAPLEAMKAQAVTARTLAVKRVNKYNSEGYDITNTTSDQVYKGYNATYFSSSHNVSKAVEQTTGVVLTYNGSLAEGVFYSNNGGQTASDGFVWGSGSSTPYYTSKKDTYDTYLHKTSLSWSKIAYTNTYNKKELRDLILDNSTKYPAYYKTPYCTPNFNGLSENYTIEVVKSTNGYVTEIKLSDDTGRSYTIKNYANRWFFGLRSQQYTLSQTGGLFVKSTTKTTKKATVYVKGANNNVSEVDESKVYIKSATDVKPVEDIKYVFEGKGYGHGIGMSQNGAMNRAEAGHTYNQILEFYYTGCKTTSNYAN